MHCYTAYGFGIRSTLPLPELALAPDAPQDVAIEVGEIGRPPGPRDATGRYAWASDDEVYFFWDSVGGFLLERGRKVTIDPLPDVEEDLVRLALLGPVLAMLLFQRGFLVMHASAVAVNGRAVAFIGHKGWGKSTTAATLHARGHALIADDLLAVDLSGEEGARVAPGFLQLKLWPEAAQASLGDDPAMLRPLHRRVNKKARPVKSEGLAAGTLPLHCIYVLGKGEAASVEAVPPQEALIELTRHAFNRGLLRSDKFALDHFKKRAALAQRVPLRRLRRAVALDKLPDVARVVEEDVTRGDAAGAVGQHPATSEASSAS